MCARRDVILGHQQPTELRLTAKHPEIVSRNGQPESELITRRNEPVIGSGSPGDGIAQRHRELIQRDNTRKNIVPLREVPILGDREVLYPSVAVQGIQLHQTLRIADGQRTQDERTEKRERRSVDANSQRQCCDRNGGKGSIPPKKTQGVAGVLSKVLDPARPTDIATLFLDLIHAAELLTNLASGLFFAEAGARQIRDTLLDVKTQFSVEMSVLFFSPQPTPVHRAPSSAIPRMSPTASDNLCQLAEPACRCARPLRVRR